MSGTTGDGWETVVHSQGVTLSAPELDNVLSVKKAQMQKLAEVDDPDETFSQIPPSVTASLFPGLLGHVVKACCYNSEAVSVAVATQVIALFTAWVGPTVYYQIGDERRLLNNYYLLIGPTGMGKGTSEYGPDRIFKRMEQYLELKFNYARDCGKADGLIDFPFLDRHEGGLSSGEGLAAAKSDGDPKKPDIDPVTDKRFFIRESEMGNVLNMAQRQGNTLSQVLRNGYDGKTIKPLTKRDQVCVTDPFFVLIGSITPGELVSHEQNSVMSVNGMLNRILMVWPQLERRQPIPKAMPQEQVNNLASALADAIVIARNGSFETHWKKQVCLARPISMDTHTEQCWVREYERLLNTHDCDLVSNLCRRHRVHCLILAATFALLDQRLVIQEQDLRAALAWIDYSRHSVIYSYRSFSAQLLAETVHQLAMDLLTVIHDIHKKQNRCSCKDIYLWYHNRLTRERLHAALEHLLSHVPPLIEHDTLKRGRGRPVQQLSLTEEGLSIVLTEHSGGG